MLYSEQPTVMLAWRHLNTMFFTNFENLKNIFQETHDCLVFTDPLIIWIYLRTTGTHFRDQWNIRHPTSKLLKCDLVQTSNTFRNLSLRIYAAGKASLVYIKLEYHHEAINTNFSVNSLIVLLRSSKTWSKCKLR